MQPFAVNKAFLQASRIVRSGSPGPINTSVSCGSSGPSSPASAFSSVLGAGRSPPASSASSAASGAHRRKSTGSVGFGPPGTVRAQLHRSAQSCAGHVRAGSGAGGQPAEGRRASFHGPAGAGPTPADAYDVPAYLPLRRHNHLRLTRITPEHVPAPARRPSQGSIHPASTPITRTTTPAPSVFEEDDDLEAPDPALDMGAVFDAAAGPADTREQLKAVRRLMADAAVNAYLVPTEDAHASEYITPADARRSYVTGFTGSAGTALVLPDAGLLFTDGRYFNQAGKQLDPRSWELMRQGAEGVPTWQEYLVQRAKDLCARGEAPLAVGVDPTLVSASDAAALNEQLKPHGAALRPLAQNLVDEAWGAARPARPHSSVFRHADRFAGAPAVAKLGALRKELQRREPAAAGMLVTALDEVAWLFNLRAADIAFNPVFFAYAYVPTDPNEDVSLFIASEQIDADPAVREYVEKTVGVKVQPYEAVWDILKTVGAAAQSSHRKVVISNRASWAVEEALGGQANVEVIRSPVGDLKAVKNATEIAGFRASHVRDGAALVRYFAWLEETLADGGREIDEYQGSVELARFRKDTGGDLFRGLSFETISSSGANAAVIHYSPPKEGSKVIKQDEVYLCDSGGQYLDGTTDVTRTLHFGTPTAEETRAFTRVLQGHIALDTAIFPKGTTGYNLDGLARRALWSDGLDYRHGTGHGVGHFGCVHEGPQGVGNRIAYNDVPLKEGMTLSNEPGFYKDDAFGIRIESVVVVRAAHTPHNFGDKGFLAFERFTMCPIQTKMVDAGLLSEAERGWLNAYHQEVLEKVEPVLQQIGDTRAVRWLRAECRAI